MTGVVLVFRDVTSKRLAERALEDRAAALTAAQEASNGAAWVLDLRARSTRWFPGGREIFGRPFAEFDDGTSPMHLVYWEDHPAVHEAERRVRELGEEFRVEFRVLWPNGELHWLEARGKADPSDENILYGVTLDVTRRKKAEAALLRAEKLSAVGSLASTIAHEVNNPLAAIVNLLYLALADGSLRPETRRLLETADEEIARLAGITRLTLTFARETPGAVTAVVAESVDAVLSLVKRKIEAREIRVEQRTDPAIVAAIKPHELRQVLLNIILNAIDAIHGTQGLLRVTTTADTSEVLIQIEDNGDGIAPGQLETIFNPFYSTKPDVGTGIGLWVSRELVQRHGGKITAASGELGDGARTRFEVRLPRS